MGKNHRVSTANRDARYESKADENINEDNHVDYSFEMDGDERRLLGVGATARVCVIPYFERIRLLA